jgi:hypothetical protein
MGEIYRKSEPARGNSVVQVTYKTSSLHDKVKLLKVKILYLTVYDDDDDDDDDDNDDIIM